MPKLRVLLTKGALLKWRKNSKQRPFKRKNKKKRKITDTQLIPLFFKKWKPNLLGPRKQKWYPYSPRKRYPPHKEMNILLTIHQKIPVPWVFLAVLSDEKPIIRVLSRNH